MAHVEVQMPDQVLQQVATLAFGFGLGDLFWFGGTTFSLGLAFLSATLLNRLGFTATALGGQNSVEQASSEAWRTDCESERQSSYEYAPFHRFRSPVH